MPTQTINLNNATPPAPADSLNVTWQADPASLDPTVVRNVSANVPVFTGDTGSGGSLGLVPAPAAGDAAAGKVLKADGTWYVPCSSFVSPMTTEGDLIVAGASGAPSRLAAGASGLVLTANGAGAIPSWQASSGGSGGSTPSAISLGPDWPPASPTTYDDEFTGSSLNAALWTKIVNGVPNTIQMGKSMLGILCFPNASGDNLTCVMQPIPTPPYTVCAKLSWFGAPVNYLNCGLCLMDSGSRIVSVGVSFVTSYTLDVDHWNSPTSWNSTQLAFPNLALSSPMYFQIQDDGTNLHFSASSDGFNFYPLYSESRTAFLSAPAYVGIMADSNNSSYWFILGCDWFRRVA